VSVLDFHVTRELMTSGRARSTRSLARTPDRDRATRAARSTANRVIAFLGHALVWAATCVLLLITAGPFAAAVVGAAWFIFLSAHGFFWVVAPRLRAVWVERAVEREVGVRVEVSAGEQRRQLEGRHAQSLVELSAAIAHEIRNPIAAAKSLLQQIAEDPSSRDTTEYLQVALAELERVERSVSHLLRYARDEDVKREPTALVDAVEAALTRLGERIERSGVALERDFGTWGELIGDREKLERIVVNLVDNALDALAEGASGPARIALSVGESLSGAEVWLRVEDNGPGIEPAELARILKPFVSTKPHGTGLGLAITDKLVKAHGGTLEVESTPGVGTCFSISLPKGELPQRTLVPSQVQRETR
jgi:signal transduction histidine kinase